MADSAKSDVTHVWERWRNVWHFLYYGTLLLVTVRVLVKEPDGATQLSILGMTLLIATGYWFVIVRHPEWVGEPRLATALYFFLTAGISLLLIRNHPLYFIFAFSLIGHIFRMLPMRWAMPGFVILLFALFRELALMIGWAILSAPFLLTTLAALAFGVLLSLWIENIIKQSRQRQELIEELEATRLELATAEREAGMLEERGRLAREIHDALAQGFTSIVMHLEAAEAVLSPGAESVQWHLDQARRAARDGLNEARRVVWALRPELLERVSLPEALTRAVRKWSEASGMAASTNITGTPRPLRADVEVTLLRAAQEALANVRKHANAERVTATLSYMATEISLDVQDDGKGSDSHPVSLDGGGFGLKAMRERVTQLGGSLLIESAPGEGTTLVIEIPLSPMEMQ